MKFTYMEVNQMTFGEKLTTLRKQHGLHRKTWLRNSRFPGKPYHAGNWIAPPRCGKLAADQ